MFKSFHDVKKSRYVGTNIIVLVRVLFAIIIRLVKLDINIVLFKFICNYVSVKSNELLNPSGRETSKVVTVPSNNISLFLTRLLLLLSVRTGYVTGEVIFITQLLFASFIYNFFKKSAIT